MTKREFAKKLADAVTNYRREMGLATKPSPWATGINCANQAGLKADPNKPREEVPIVNIIDKICWMDKSHPESILLVFALMEEAWDHYQKVDLLSFPHSNESFRD